MSATGQPPVELGGFGEKKKDTLMQRAHYLHLPVKLCRISQLPLSCFLSFSFFVCKSISLEMVSRARCTAGVPFFCGTACGRQRPRSIDCDACGDRPFFTFKSGAVGQPSPNFHFPTGPSGIHAAFLGNPYGIHKASLGIFGASLSYAARLPMESVCKPKEILGLTKRIQRGTIWNS